MKVSDILRVKGNTLYTALPDEPLGSALNLMAEKDIGSLVVMDHVLQHRAQCGDDSDKGELRVLLWHNQELNLSNECG